MRRQRQDFKCFKHLEMTVICGLLLWFFCVTFVSFYKYFVYIMFCASTKIKLFLELNATLTSSPLKSQNFILSKLAFNSITLILFLCFHFNYKAVTMFKLQNVQYLVVNNLSTILYSIILGDT